MRNPYAVSLFLSTLLAGGVAFAQPPAADGSGPVDITLSENAQEPAEKLVLGWIENIRLLPGRSIMKAKLDSGAKSSAMHAEDIEFFEKDGRDMVRFTVLKDHQDPDSERFIYERPLVRAVNIKLRYTSVRDERPAVRLEFCLAGVRHNAVFSLTNRSDFNYPVLLGREFLKHNILVDSSTSFTHRTRCPRQ